MPKKTKILSFNLKERGRKHTGQDRSNLDVPAMIKHINSAPVQELISTKSLLGFYGHQIRQRFGLFPPETAIIEGRVVQLEAAFHTIGLKAHDDGTVEHQHEFADNAAGQKAQQQYAANMGGFSTAVRYAKQGLKAVPTLFAGFDFVWQPNYATNVGDGVLLDGLYIDESEAEYAEFDSIHDPAQAVKIQLLDQQILQVYDAIHTEAALNEHLGNTLDQVGQLMQENQRILDRQNHRAELQRQRQEDLYDGMVGTTISFEEQIARANQFLQNENTQVSQQRQASKPDNPKVQPKWLGLGFGL